MATRPVFIAVDSKPFVNVINTEFKFYPGFAISQAQKSVKSLHGAFIAEHPEYNDKLLEISSRSLVPLGIQLSAFNLQYKMSNGELHTVETTFQASKCFDNGCQYTDLLNKSSFEAKKDERLHTSGNVIAFSLEGTGFPVQPTTFFYDWLYVNAVYQNKKLADHLLHYAAFTDIAFNPAKSINCQARSAALYVSLAQKGILREALISPKAFETLVYDYQISKVTYETHTEQLTLFDL